MEKSGGWLDLNLRSNDLIIIRPFVIYTSVLKATNHLQNLSVRLAARRSSLSEAVLPVTGFV